MEKPATATIEEHFGSITDPRIERTKRHKLIDILIIAICATICGCDNGEDISRIWRSEARMVCDIPGIAEWYSFA
ncbi:MAG: transposase family protein [Anaerolineales bacterium]|nr:transposase family protein [Anaerolineales bacterium]